MWPAVAFTKMMAFGIAQRSSKDDGGQSEVSSSNGEGQLRACGRRCGIGNDSASGVFAAYRDHLTGLEHLSGGFSPSE